MCLVQHLQISFQHLTGPQLCCSPPFICAPASLLDATVKLCLWRSAIHRQEDSETHLYVVLESFHRQVGAGNTSCCNQIVKPMIRGKEKHFGKTLGHRHWKPRAQDPCPVEMMSLVMSPHLTPPGRGQTVPIVPQSPGSTFPRSHPSPGTGTPPPNPEETIRKNKPTQKPIRQKTKTKPQNTTRKTNQTNNQFQIQLPCL